MKYIKKFNESTDDPSIFYKVVTMYDYDNPGPEVMIQPNKIDIIKNLLPDDIKLTYNKIGDNKGGSRFRLYRDIKSKYFYRKIVNMLIKHLEDEYFILRMNILTYDRISEDSEDEHQTTMYFKCDQFEGLLEFIKRTFEIKN